MDPSNGRFLSSVNYFCGEAKGQFQICQNVSMKEFRPSRFLNSKNPVTKIGNKSYDESLSTLVQLNIG